MEILGRINWVDVLIIIIMIRISYGGFRDGLSHEIFPLIGALVILVSTLRYYKQIGSLLSQYMANAPSSVTDSAGFVAMAVVAGFALKLIKIVVDKIIKVTWHPAIEKAGGLLAGVARATMAVSIVLIALSLLPLSYLQRSIRDRSLMGMYFLRVGPEIYSGTAGLIPREGKKWAFAGCEDMVREIASDKSVFHTTEAGK
jgi:uncharacterized membrane protein required for colicin V production